MNAEMNDYNYCILGDYECNDYHYEYTQNNPYNVIYYDEIFDFSNYIINENTIIIVSYMSLESFILPKIDNESIVLSILCIYCGRVIFDLSAIPNVAFTIARYEGTYISSMYKSLLLSK